MRMKILVMSNQRGQSWMMRTSQSLGIITTGGETRTGTMEREEERGSTVQCRRTVNVRRLPQASQSEGVRVRGRKREKRRITRGLTCLCRKGGGGNRVTMRRAGPGVGGCLEVLPGLPPPILITGKSPRCPRNELSPARPEGENPPNEDSRLQCREGTGLGLGPLVTETGPILQPGGVSGL